MPTSRHRTGGARAWARLGTWASVALLLAGPLAEAARAAGPPADSPAAQGRHSYLGLTLTEALLDLESRGLRIVFTSELVRPEMRVESEPASTDPRRILDEILAPHGLWAEDGPGGTVVVRAAADRPAGGSIAGTVRGRGTPAPLAGATVRVVGRDIGPNIGPNIATRTDAAGRFAIEALEPGVYTLEAERPDFLPARVSGVAVGAGRPASVELTLEPVPHLREEIVVRPSRLTLLDGQPPAPLSLSREDIEALPHLAGDLFRALSLLPGTAANDVTAQFHIHGGRRDEVEILLDGQELYEAYHLQDFDRALSVVEPGGLAGASLSTEAFPASYGDRMGGVLDLTTAAPAGGREGRLSLSSMSAVAGGGGTFGAGRGTWRASARHGFVDLAGRLLGDEDPSFWDAFGKAEWRLTDRQSLRAHLLETGDALDFRESAGGERRHFDTDYDSSYLWLAHQATLGERLLAETTLSWSGFDRDRRGAEAETEQDFAIADLRESEIAGVGQSWTLDLAPSRTLQWGFEARRYETGYDYASEVEDEFELSSDQGTPPADLERFAHRFQGDHLGAFASGRFSPLAPLAVELGLRYDRHTLTSDTLVSPRVNLAWRLGEESVLRASWGLFHQSQRPYELEVEDGETRFSPAERSQHWVLGYERLVGRRERAPLHALRVEAYWRSIRDPRPRYESLFEPLNLFPEAEPDRLRIAPESSRAAGVELTLRGALGARTDWWANYAYAVAEDRIQGENIPRQTDQPHTLNLFLDRRLGKNWSLSLAWRFHSGWPTTPASLSSVEDEEGEPQPVLVLGPLDSERLPDYHRLDLRASRAWELRSGRLVFFLDLQNVYNRRNPAGFDYSVDDEGRLVVEGERWPGFFPSLGITWEF